jgi:hypothetical protein
MRDTHKWRRDNPADGLTITQWSMYLAIPGMMPEYAMTNGSGSLYGSSTFHGSSLSQRIRTFAEVECETTRAED